MRAARVRAPVVDMITARELTTDLLLRLTSGTLLAVRIPRFADPETCHRLGSWLVSHRSREPYAHEHARNGVLEYTYYGVDRVGQPFNQLLGTHGDSPQRRSYYQAALPNIRALRAAALPALSPIDALRLELDELWPGGARLASFEGKKMFFGIGRVMSAETSAASEETPHFDELPASVFPLAGQYAANIYLAVPSDGGELEVWRSFGRLPGVPVPASRRPTADADIMLKPDVGDLVIFNAWHLHAIRRFSDGVRASLQGFIGYVAADEPLLLWD
jgi:hypothetical protein